MKRYLTRYVDAACLFFFAWSGKCSTQEAVNRGHHLWPLYKINVDLPVEAGKGSNENSINNRGK